MFNKKDKTEVIVSLQQPKNLKEILLKAEFSSENVTPTVSKFNEPRCRTCELTITGSSLELKCGKVWTIKSSMNYKSKDIIYIIICCKCKDYYVGQTQNLRNRVSLNKEQINHEQYRHLPASKHLANCSTGKFKIMSIFQCRNNNEIERECKDKKIISILEPKLNSDN